MADTPRRSFRIPNDLYSKARRVADSHEESLTDVVSKALADYATKGPKRVRNRRKDTVPVGE